MYSNKKKSVNGKSVRDDELQKAIVFCHHNNYKIYPQVNKDSTKQVVIEKGGRKAVVNDLFTQKTIHKAIDDMYLRIYKKQNQ